MVTKAKIFSYFYLLYEYEAVHISLCSNNLPQRMRLTIKFINFRTPENCAVIYLKFKKRGQTSRYFVKKMQME